VSLFKTLRVKPWLPEEIVEPATSNDVLLTQEQIATTALHFLLAVITVIFFLFTITFLQRTQSFDFQALSGEPWLPFTNSGVLWQNTAYLFLASISIICAKKFAQQARLYALVITLSATSLFTLLFIIGQVQVWQQLSQAGFYIYSNPANSYYFLLTGVHALHIVGGVLALLSCIVVFAKGYAYPQLSYRLRLCGLYWHYLLGIWLLLFLLLTSDAETFKTIALICGF